MDLTTACLFCVISFTLITLSEGSSTNSDCRQCKPGYYASRLCSPTHDTICSPCAKGTFTSQLNHLKSCSQCSKCDTGEFVSKPCTLFSDTVCTPCSAVSDFKSIDFSRNCVQNDNPVSLTDIGHETLQLKDHNEKRTSGVDHNINIYEGSGVPEYEVKHISHVSGEEIIEGSGEIIESPTAANETTSAPIVIIPDAVDDQIEEVITKSTTSNVTYITTTESTVSSLSPRTASTTIKEGIVIIDSGIRLENGTRKPSETDKVLLSVPKATHAKATTINPTTAGEIVIEPEEGIVLQDTPVTKKNDVIVVNVVENVPEDEPRVGASQAKDSGTDSSGVSVGLFVAVCIICAAVFFVLGLIVNKYWGKRRARSFNVEQAEKQNGQKFHDGKIDFKDPENNITTKTGIYDEIPADKVNGKNEKEAHIKPATAAPVYSKPVKRHVNGKTNKENGTGDADKLADNEWGGMLISRHSSSGSLILSPALEKPVDEARNSRHSASIQYMDEEQTDEETDKLLPQQPSQDEQIQSDMSPEASNDDTTENEEVATEITPMISGDNDTINV